MGYYDPLLLLAYEYTTLHQRALRRQAAHDRLVALLRSQHPAPWRRRIARLLSALLCRLHRLRLLLWSTGR